MELQLIQNKIYEIRGQKVMLDFDLAELYGVQTKVLNQAVKRNIDRFPKDFMFQLTKVEFNNLRSQIVTSSWFSELQSQILELKEYIDDILIDQNDINEDTRLQIELINQTLAEMHLEKKINDKPRKRIGFNTEE